MFRILVVDDEAAILGLLKTLLEPASFQVDTAASAAEAKTRLQEKAFDIILTDMRMETPLAGYDVVRAARQVRPRPAIAILTAFPISRSEWLPSGADALFVKGLDLISLPDKLRALIDQQAQSGVLPESSLKRSTQSQ
jgi:DNA-binding response OmpR family regulator